MISSWSKIVFVENPLKSARKYIRKARINGIKIEKQKLDPYTIYLDTCLMISIVPVSKKQFENLKPPQKAIKKKDKFAVKIYVKFYEKDGDTAVAVIVNGENYYLVSSKIGAPSGS